MLTITLTTFYGQCAIHGAIDQAYRGMIGAEVLQTIRVLNQTLRIPVDFRSHYVGGLKPNITPFEMALDKALSVGRESDVFGLLCDIMNLLIELGAHVSGEHFVIACGSNLPLVLIQQMLIRGGADANALGYHGATPLFAAAHSFKPATREYTLCLFDLLIRNGADINYVFDNKLMIMHVCMYDAVLFEYLIDKGMNLYIFCNLTDHRDMLQAAAGWSVDEDERARLLYKYANRLTVLFHLLSMKEKSDVHTVVHGNYVDISLV